MTVRYDEQIFQLAKAVTDTVVAPDLISFNPQISVTCPPGSPDRWWIGVVVLGCVLGIILVIICVYFLERRKVNNRLRALEANETKNHVNGLGVISDNITPQITRPSDTVSQRRERQGGHQSIDTTGTLVELISGTRRRSSFPPVSPHTDGPYTPITELPQTQLQRNPSGSINELPNSTPQHHAP